MRFLLLVPVLLVPIAAVVAVLVALARSTRDARLDVAHRLEGHRGILRLLGAALGLVAAGVLVSDDTLGLGLLLAAPTAGLGLLLGVLAAELVVRPPSGPRRSASLSRRHVGDYLPRRMTAVVVTTGTTLLVLGVVTTALGSPDDLGRPGRWLAYECSPVQGASHGPWPGSYYTLPLLAMVGAGILLALLVLRASVARPPLLPEDGDATARLVPVAAAVAADDELRAQSARAVVAAVGALLALPLAGTSLLSAIAVGGLVGCAPTWWAVVAAGLWVVAALAVAVLVWCVSVLLVGARQPALPVQAGTP